MNTSPKDGIPFRGRAARAGVPLDFPARELARKAASARPSTGRLTLPVQERRIALRGQLTRMVGSCCIARLVVLAADDQKTPIIMHIDSPDGSITEAMGILSTMNGIRCPVITFCRREVMGPAAIIAAHGLPGYRTAAPGCRFSLRLSSANGRTNYNLDSLAGVLAEVLTKDARKEQEQVLGWLKHGGEFGVQEALGMGIIDAIANEPILPKTA